METDWVKSNENLYTVVLASIVSFMLIYLLWNRTRGRKLPPGPIGLPLIGYLPFVTRKPYIKFMELRKTYGPVYSLRIGSRYIVVLADYPSIKEAFSQDAFFGRPPDSAFELNKETIRLNAMNGLKWKEQRRFTIQTLKDLGFYRETMEKHIREEIHELLERLAKEKDNPITVSNFLAPSMSNNISSLVFGKRRHFEDPTRVLLDQILKEVGRSVGQVAWHSFFPWLKAVLKFLGFHQKVSKVFLQMRNYVRKEIQEHETTFNVNDTRDFIDGYLQEMEKKKADPNSTFQKPVLVDLVGGLFGAGSETVRVSLDWLLLISASWPDVQKKVQAEIDDVIGRERFPHRTDSKRMPYTDAVISEQLRWRSVVPINILRYTLEDTQLGPYFIPKDSYVVANLWDPLHDPELWGPDVEDFKPERFLSDDGKSVQKPDYFIPFSTGKRQCPGEPLALLEVFMYYTAILQKFEVSLPEGAVPDFEGQLGLSLQAKPYKLCLKLR